MGQKASSSSQMPFAFSQFQKTKVPKYIAQSKNLTFALGQKLNFIGHTTIVVVFDGVPTFTVDFGTYKKMIPVARAVLCKSATPAVNINIFDQRRIEIISIMDSFTIESEWKKDISVNLFQVLLSIPANCYDLIEFNCRNYVTAAILVIHEFASQNWNNFDWDCIDLELLKDVAVVYIEDVNLTQID